MLSIKFDPSGDNALISSTDKNVYVCDLATGRNLMTLKGHSESVFSAKFSPDGQYIVTGSADESAILWDSSTGKLLAPFKSSQGSIYDVHFNPNGLQLFSTNGEEFSIWDIKTKSLIGTGYGSVVDFSSDGTKTVIGDEFGNMFLINSRGEVPTLFDGHNERITSVSFNFDGTKLISSSTRGVSKIWEVSSGDELASLYKSNNNSTYFSGFSPDGSKAFTVSEENENSIILWDARTQSPLNVNLQQPGKRLLDTVVGSKASKVLAKFENGEINIFDVQSSAKNVKLDGEFEEFEHMQLTYDEAKVFTFSTQQVARIWNVDDGKLISEFEVGSGDISSIRISPMGGVFIASYSNGIAEIWNTEAKEKISVLENHSVPISISRFAESGDKVLTISEDHIARLWDTFSGKMLKKFPGNFTSQSLIGVAPDGHSVFTISDNNEIFLWDASNGNQKMGFKGHTAAITSATFSNDGKMIVTSSMDGSVLLWNVANGEVIFEYIRGEKRPVLSAGLDASGRFLLTSEVEATFLWDANLGTIIEFIENPKDNSSIFVGSTFSFLVKNSDYSIFRVSNIKYYQIKSSLSADYLFSLAALSEGSCLFPSRRKRANLKPSPPCWCQEKATPNLSVWENDYLFRNEYFDYPYTQENWPEGTKKPNPFTHKRADGWICPPSGQGYSAPWMKYPDLTCLTEADLVGPASAVINKLRSDDACIATFKNHGTTVDTYLNLP